MKQLINQHKEGCIAAAFLIPSVIVGVLFGAYWATVSIAVKVVFDVLGLVVGLAILRSPKTRKFVDEHQPAIRMMVIGSLVYTAVACVVFYSGVFYTLCAGFSLLLAVAFTALTLWIRKHPADTDS